MGVVLNPDSELAKEQAKWNKPYRFEKYPQLMYRAIKRPDGVVVCGDPNSEAISRQCFLTVRSDSECQKAMEAGWRETPKDALEFFERREQSIAEMAARRHYEDRNMSESAKAEAKAADDATPEHLPEVPVKKRRGRPPKNAAPAA